jgi:hypothetical protein
MIGAAIVELILGVRAKQRSLGYCDTAYRDRGRDRLLRMTASDLLASILRRFMADRRCQRSVLGRVKVATKL